MNSFEQMEEALRISEEKYHNILDNIEDGYCELDHQGCVTFFNNSLCKMLGCSSEELSGSYYRQYLEEDLADKVSQVFKKVQRTGVPMKGMEHYVWLKDGNRKQVEISVSPIKGTGNQGVGFSCIIHDITERKRIEEEHFRMEKLESLGLLAGGIAHDFNNILTVILGNISLARLWIDSSDAPYTLLIEAEKACQRARDLTQQLLTFARGGAPIKKTVSIEHLIRESAVFALRGSNVRCEYEIPDNIWPVDVDESQISQVISNLIINADQAMPEGGVVSIHCDNVVLDELNVSSLPAGEYVQITVSDEGIGISEEHLSKVFDPYFTTKPRGSGLGMATAYSTVKKHNGHITVDSVVDNGTVFKVYLPAHSHGTITEESFDNQVAVGKGRILVMDDYEGVRKTMGEMLKRLGYQVALAVDGNQVHSLYRQAQEAGQPYDAVIIGLTIPGGMGGRETIKRLLQLDPEVKAIVSSGYANDQVMAEYRQWGFKGMITKPYSIKELSEVLFSVIVGDKDVVDDF